MHTLLDKEIHLHIPEKSGGYFLFIILEIAANMMKDKNATVIYIHRYVIPNTISIFTKCKIYKYKKINDYIDFFKKNIFRKKNHNKSKVDSIYDKYRSCNDFVIPVGAGYLKFLKPIKGNKINLFTYIKSVIIFFKLTGFNKKKYKKFLEYKLSDIQVGDLVGATALAIDVNAGGDLTKATCQILSSICDIINLSKSVCDLGINDVNQNFVLTFEPTYLEVFLKRKLHKNGMSILTIDHYSKPYHYINNTDENKLAYVACNPEELTPKRVKEVSQYMKKRLNNPGDVIDYMKQIKYDNSGFVSECGMSIDADCGLNIILYLHAFSDASYVYGLDDFNDLFDWVSFTIDELIKNNNVNKILIKKHPAYISKIRLHESIAITRLHAKYKKIARVIWLNPLIKVSDLLGKDNCVGITHHGSVAEELVYCKIPVIASIFSPWTDKYKFCYLWKDKVEYANLIKNIHKISSAGVNKVQKVHLYKYIYDFRLSVDLMDKRPFWGKYFWYRYPDKYSKNNLREGDITYNEFLVLSNHLESINYNDLAEVDFFTKITVQ